MSTSASTLAATSPPSNIAPTTDITITIVILVGGVCGLVAVTIGVLVCLKMGKCNLNKFSRQKSDTMELIGNENVSTETGVAMPGSNRKTK